MFIDQYAMVIMRTNLSKTLENKLGLVLLITKTIQELAITKHEIINNYRIC